MEGIKVTLNRRGISLGQAQGSGVSLMFENLGRTKFVDRDSTQDARGNVHNVGGRMKRTGDAGMSSSTGMMAEPSSSEDDDELNIHANSSLPGTPAAPLGGGLSTDGLPFHERYKPKTLPSFKKLKGSKPRNDETSSARELPSPKQATGTRTRKGDSSTTLSEASRPGVSRRTTRNSREPSCLVESQASSLESSQSVVSTLDAISERKRADPIGTMLKQKKSEKLKEHTKTKPGRFSSHKTSNSSNVPELRAIPSVTSSCSIDNLYKEESATPPDNNKENRRRMKDSILSEESVVNISSSTTRAKGKGDEPVLKPFPFASASRRKGKKETPSNSSLKAVTSNVKSRSLSFASRERSPPITPLRSSSSSLQKSVGVTENKYDETSGQGSSSQRKFDPFPLQLPSSSQNSSKRSSDEDLLDSSPLKRMRASGFESFEEVSLDDDFSFTQDVKADPKTICPFCDLPFPADPSPLLTQMLRRASSRAYRDPRPTNVLGLKADVTVFIDMCHRHRFEVEQLPKALAHGWPQKIDFHALPNRVEALRARLERVLDNKEENYFWKEIKKSLEKDGLMKTIGLSGQMDAFQNCQPGYYGELGAMIIYQTLNSIFPLEAMKSEKIAPLPAADFIQRILVPQAGIALIQEDMGIGEEQALLALRESSSYGAAMFPVTDKDGADDEVHDELIKERARVRRREIEATEGLQQPGKKRSSSRSGSGRRMDLSFPSKPSGKAGGSRLKRNRKTSSADENVRVLSSDSAADSDLTQRSTIGGNKRTTRKSSKASRSPSPDPQFSASFKSVAKGGFTSATDTTTTRGRARPKPRLPASVLLDIDEEKTLQISRPPWESSSQGTETHPPERNLHNRKSKLSGKSLPLAMAKSRTLTMKESSSTRMHGTLDRDTGEDDLLSEPMPQDQGERPPRDNNDPKDWLFSP